MLEKTFEIGMIAHWGICDDTDPNVALQVYIKYGHRSFKHDLAAFGYGTEITKDIPGVGAVLGGEETFGLLELTVTISARLTGSLAATNLEIGFDICVEEIEGAIKQCMSEMPLYGDKWWPILIPPSGAGMSFTSACSATRRLEEEQRDEERRLEEQRRELEFQYAEDQFQESKGCAKDLKVSKVVVHDKYDPWLRSRTTSLSSGSPKTCPTASSRPARRASTARHLRSCSMALRWSPTAGPRR